MNNHSHSNFSIPTGNTANSTSNNGSRYYRQSSGSSNVPLSNYSSLINAVPMNGQPSSSGYPGGSAMYPQTLVNQGHPSSLAYQPRHGAQAYGGAQPTTPDASGSGFQYLNTAAHPPASQQQPYAFTEPYSSTTQYENDYSNLTTAPRPYAGYPVTVPIPFAAPGPSTSTKQCYNCGKASTPLWRRDPVTRRMLCNACGLYQQQRRQPRPQVLIDADNEEDEEQLVVGDGPQCSHCGTRKTCVWRRNKEGQQVCNACGVYYSHNGRERPVTMKRSKVKPRAKHTPL
ncbi:GATA zinc finger domain-containing protein [Mycena venus]|uniref:GATA zinc finger domain-containing protein n=1 Tax=Mycena venus TaxID=2733690 RepID=A0A8H6YJ18_9AGAR|nr:GATA zinc finger domain-containing protein [Mycena venus]